MRNTHAMAALLAAALVLTGCENDAASWQGAEPGVSLTLIREQPWVWDPAAAVTVVVARLPDCQRRHSLRATRPAEDEVEVSMAGPGRYLLRQGEDWHLASAADCSLEAVPPPGSPPTPLGVFQREAGRLRFVDRSPPA